MDESQQPNQVSQADTHPPTTPEPTGAVPPPSPDEATPPSARTGEAPGDDVASPPSHAAAPDVADGAAEPTDEADDRPTDGDPGGPDESEGSDDGPRRRILIGSQRDPAAYRPRRRDWLPIEGEKPKSRGPRRPAGSKEQRPARGRQDRDPKAKSSATEAPGTTPDARPQAEPKTSPEANAETPRESQPRPQREAPTPPTPEAPAPPVGRFPPPNLRDRLSPDLEDEFEQALGGESMDELIGGDSSAMREMLEPESRHAGRVLAVRRDDVFIELGQREQGILSLVKFDKPPEPGDVVEVVVQRFNVEEGIYELSLPGAAAHVEDWSDLSEGVIVEAAVTGHNTGGLEAEVNRIRAFIPVSQVELFRVENLAAYVGQRLTCLVTEANPDRRNLVLSRRAILEREKAEARQKLLESLAPGQVHEGVVRKLMDFGAFVDLGGVDGLIHVSQLSWARVAHPRDVLSEGQKVQVKIEKVNHETGKIGLSYRELQENPWTHAAEKYPTNSVVQGKVTRLAEFGAFVELEPGIEGLIHISELAYRRVWRASDVLSEGQEIEALVLSCDADAQRIGLSIKALAPKPEPAKKDGDADAAESPSQSPPRKKKQPDQPLTGGLGRVKGGERFGLKW